MQRQEDCQLEASLGYRDPVFNNSSSMKAGLKTSGVEAGWWPTFAIPGPRQSSPAEFEASLTERLSLKTKT